MWAHASTIIKPKCLTKGFHTTKKQFMWNLESFACSGEWALVLNILTHCSYNQSHYPVLHATIINKTLTYKHQREQKLFTVSDIKSDEHPLGFRKEQMKQQKS
jgi:hypothetical protein